MLKNRNISIFQFTAVYPIIVCCMLSISFRKRCTSKHPNRVKSIDTKKSNDNMTKSETDICTHNKGNMLYYVYASTQC